MRPGTACSASNPAALPVGLSIDPARGFITGTVAAGADVGSPYSVTVTATDGTYSDSQTFAWTVQHLLLADPGDQTNDDGASVSLPLTATTATGDTLTFGASGLPTGLSIDGGTGLISGTIDPAADAGGPYAVTVTATNSDAFDSQSFTWNVNNPISINPVGDQTNAVGDSASLAVSATTATGDPLTYSASGLPAGLSINASTGLISGTVAVYEAQDLMVHRKVVLKVMRPELTARHEARERFLREAQTAGGLEHDHVIPVYQVGEDNGVLFIAMPLLKGEALDARLAREGRLPIAAVVKIGRETAEGLAAAHVQGLVHRDVKPANLWLEGTGEAGVGFRRVKILDFGLARAVQDDQHLTAAGGVLGTPAYMAPEQADGQEVDHRADLFGLGAVLYRCCTGEPPFAGATTMAVLSALANRDAAPLRQKNPAAPAALEAVVMRMLAKAPADRPQSATEAAEVLRKIEQEHGTMTALPPAPSEPAPPQAAPRRRRVSALAVCLAALVGLGAAVTAGVIVVKVRTPDGKQTEVTAPTGSKVDVDDKGNVTVGLPVDAPPMPAPADGANKAADPPELEFRLKDGSSPVCGLVVAPDGKTIVAGSLDGKLRVWDLETRQVVRTYSASASVMALALHPDGKTVAAMCSDGSLFTWDLEKGELIRQFTGYPVHSWGVTFARKGDLIVTPDCDTQAVICWDAKTGEHRVLARFPDEKKNPIDSIAASPDGEQVAVTNMWGLSPTRFLKLSSGEVVSTLPVQLSGGPNPVFAEDGKELLTAQEGRGLLLWNRDALYPQAFFASESQFRGISLAPGGRFLAAAGGDGGTVDLWVRDRLVPFREWSGLATAQRVAFTPDGKRLLSSHGDGTICVFRLSKDIPALHGFPPLDPNWLARTTKLPSDEQVKEVAAELARRNPGFDDPLEFEKDGEGRVFQVRVDTAKLEDLSPFRGFPALTELRATSQQKHGGGRVWDLSCLRGMNLILQRLSLTPTSPGHFGLATFAMAFLRDAVPLLPPRRPVQDLRLIPPPYVEQMHQQRPHLGHAHLRPFFPPTAAFAARGTIGPAATARYGGASPSSPASRTRPARTPPWPPRNSVPPTNGRPAHKPASPGEPPPARWSGGTSPPPAAPATAAPGSARVRTAAPPH